jgi:DNA-binding transcriptional LysR family regulator
MIMDRVSLVGLQVVCEVARRGSFSAAAESLGYTQSAVSRQVAHAERAARRELFERHARGARPTPAGETLVRHATAALAELQAAAVALEDLDGRRSRRVRLGAFSTAMAALVPDSLSALARAEPGLTVVLREGLSARLCDGVAAGRLALAIVAVSADQRDDVELEPLLEDRLLVALPRTHPLAGRSSLAPEELAGESWIAGSAEPGSTLLGAWATGSRPPRIAYVVRDWTAKIGLVAGGHGLTIVPGLSATALPASVVLAAIDDPAAVRAIALAAREGALEPHVQALADALRETARLLERRL